MFADTQDRPALDERYLTATNTSDLTVETDRRSPGDLALAAGMSRQHCGLALLHLLGAWEKADKPRKWTPAEIAKRAAELKDKKGKPDLRRATVEALVWHATALRQLAARLPGRNAALGYLRTWADAYGVDPDLLSPALYHWLSPNCGACDGHGKLRIPDTPSLSQKSCQHCGGIGKWPRPHGAEAIHDRIKMCVGWAKGGMVHAYYGD